MRPAEFWEDFAPWYSSSQQGEAPGRIVDRLFDLGMLAQGYSVLEVGSGTGAYSLELAPRVRFLTCLDSSQAMLDILSRRLSEGGFGNVETVRGDWNDRVPSKDYDACILPLCPGSDSPESILRMEGSARESCAIVSWVVNHGDDLENKVWRAIGRAPPKVSRGSTAAEDWLGSNGREPTVETFRVSIEKEIPVGRKLDQMCAIFRAQGVAEDISDVIVGLMSPDIDGNSYVYRAENVLKLTCWHMRIL